MLACRPRGSVASSWFSGSQLLAATNMHHAAIDAGVRFTAVQLEPRNRHYISSAKPTARSGECADEVDEAPGLATFPCCRPSRLSATGGQMKLRPFAAGGLKPSENQRRADSAGGAPGQRHQADLLDPTRPRSGYEPRATTSWTAFSPADIRARPGCSAPSSIGCTDSSTAAADEPPPGMDLDGTRTWLRTAASTPVRNRDHRSRRRQCPQQSAAATTGKPGSKIDNKATPLPCRFAIGVLFPAKTIMMNLRSPPVRLRSSSPYSESMLRSSRHRQSPGGSDFCRRLKGRHQGRYRPVQAAAMVNSDK